MKSAKVADLELLEARVSPCVQRGALVTRRRSAEQNAPVRWCRRRLFISPSSQRWEERHQLVDADSGRERVLGRAGSCRPPVQGKEANIIVSPRGRRGARRQAGCWPARGAAASAVVTTASANSRAGAARSSAGKRQVPGRSRQDQARRPWRPRRGGSGQEEGGGRAGRREAGEPASQRRGSPAPAPQPHQLHGDQVSVSGAGNPRFQGD